MSPFALWKTVTEQSNDWELNFGVLNRVNRCSSALMDASLLSKSRFQQPEFLSIEENRHPLVRNFCWDWWRQKKQSNTNGNNNNNNNDFYVTSIYCSAYSVCKSQMLLPKQKNWPLIERMEAVQLTSKSGSLIYFANTGRWILHCHIIALCWKFI